MHSDQKNILYKFAVSILGIPITCTILTVVYWAHNSRRIQIAEKLELSIFTLVNRLDEIAN